MKTGKEASMGRLIRRLLIFAWVGLFAGAAGVRAQSAETIVQDTLRRADGSVATGSVTVRWNSFTTSGGQAVAADQKTWKTDANGVVTLSATAADKGGAPPHPLRVRIIHITRERKTPLKRLRLEWGTLKATSSVEGFLPTESARSSFPALS